MQQVLSREGKDTLSVQDLTWLLSSPYQLYRLLFSAELLQQQFPPTHDKNSSLCAAITFGLEIAENTCAPQTLVAPPLPCLAFFKYLGTESVPRPASEHLQ